MPYERKKWDLKLNSIETANENQYLFDYLYDKKHFLTNLQIEFVENNDLSKILFTCIDDDRYYSEVDIEKKELLCLNYDKYSDFSENTTAISEKTQQQSNDSHLFQIYWKIKLKGSHINLYKSDIIEESNLLLKSIYTFIDCAEDRELPDEIFERIPLAQICSKKLLRRSIQF